MAFSTSDKRLTRSHARAGAPVTASTTPNGASTPSSAVQSTQGFSKAGRRVLAELACNDSPIVGLFPAGTPTSCKDKSSDGGPVRSRRALLADAVPTHPACTPLGESLLRSQVQLLLQKVASDMSAKQLEKASYMHIGNGMGASPTMLAAPTPLNTPASLGVTQAPQPNPKKEIDLCSQDAIIDATIEAAEFSISVNMLVGRHPDSQDELCNVAPLETHLLPQSVSTTLSTAVQPPLLIEVSDTPSSSEIFIGKRVLHFDDDTPCKTSQEKPSTRVFFSEETGYSTPEMRQLDDDEVSEWSVNVNVGSPADRQCLVEVSEGTTTGDTSALSVRPTTLHEHLKKMQQASNAKVHLLWDEDTERKGVQGEREIEVLCDDDPDDENDEEYLEDYFFGEEDEECDDLCDMFRDIGFGEVSKGLPKGEGKHIRFLYEDGDDEIVEAMVVNGEEDVSDSSAVIRLRGLPAPSGRHQRFVQDEETAG